MTEQFGGLRAQGLARVGLRGVTLSFFGWINGLVCRVKGLGFRV